MSGNNQKPENPAPAKPLPGSIPGGAALALQEAQAIVQSAERDVAQKCMTEINAILKNYGYELRVHQEVVLKKLG